MANLLVSGVILGFLLSLYILGSVIISSHLTKKPTAEEVTKNKVTSKMGLIIIPISFGIVLTIFSVNLLTGAPLKQGDDVSNWITLTVEIWVGIAIALVILIYSQFQSKRLMKELRKDVSADTAFQLNALTTASNIQIATVSEEVTSQEDTSQQAATSFEEAYSSPGQSDNE